LDWEEGLRGRRDEVFLEQDFTGSDWSVHGDSTYRWVGLLGESGWIMRSNPAAMAGQYEEVMLPRTKTSRRQSSAMDQMKETILLWVAWSIGNI
jgi:hypothetical protein